MDFNKIIAVIFLLIFVIGFFGNAFVLIMLIRQRGQWSVFFCYLFNLAVADMIFLCTMPFWAYTYMEEFRWHFGLGMCKLLGGITSINMFASIFFVTAMSIDRWLAVVHSIRSLRYRTQMTASWVCLINWCVAILLATPRFIYQILYCHPSSNIQDLDSGLNVTHEEFSTSSNAVKPVVAEDCKDENKVFAVCTFIFPDEHRNHAFLNGFINLFNAIVGFIIPSIVICVCYVQILNTVKKAMISKSERRDEVVKVCAIIIITFLICWSPLQLINIYAALTKWWGIFTHDPNFFHAFKSFAICLAWVNSCINPIFYAFLNKRFKRLCFVCKPNNKEASPNHQHDNRSGVLSLSGNRHSPKVNDVNELRCLQNEDNVETVEENQDAT